MKMVTGRNRRSVVGKDVYVGVDVHNFRPVTEDQVRQFVARVA